MVRALMLDVSPELLDERRRRGLDRRDEVWEGVLHMVPPPHSDHQDINDELGAFFRFHWQALGLGRTLLETGVKRPRTPDLPALGAGVPRDYRTPDRSFLLPASYDRLQGGWVVGPPDAVLEVRSPGDETLEKLPWYFDLGVREVILIDRDTREVEVLARGERAFEPVATDADGWLRSDVLSTLLRREPGADRPALRLRRTDDPTREHVIP
ncbi:MAG: Uma2 family endonuclease [Planctomycetes bacterium]|nr:Uma2 family endonuclease [Planctomycetota bacterium]